MVNIKTLRDECAFLYLGPLIQLDMMRQVQGFPASSVDGLVKQAYEGADLVLAAREKIGPAIVPGIASP